MMEPAQVVLVVLAAVHLAILALVVQAIPQAHHPRKVLTVVVEQTQAHTPVVEVEVAAHQELPDQPGQDRLPEQGAREHPQASQVRPLPMLVAAAQVLQITELAHQAEQEVGAMAAIAAT